MLRKQGKEGGEISLIKFPTSSRFNVVKRDESSIRKLLIHIASIFLSNIRQNFFSNYYCCNRLLLVTNTFHEHWLSYTPFRRADLTPGKQPQPVLSPFTTKPNNRPFTKQHFYPFSLPRKSPSVP